MQISQQNTIVALQNTVIITIRQKMRAAVCATYFYGLSDQSVNPFPQTETHKFKAQITKLQRTLNPQNAVKDKINVSPCYSLSDEKKKKFM